jgi:8-oxo-dGTP diphosphatase
MSMQKNIYVAGFAFTADRREVLLVEKQRPDWQKDLWNGVGGKVNPGERASEAMDREFHEETSISIRQNWELFCVEDGPGYRVHFYRSFCWLVGVPIRPVNDVGEILDLHYVDRLANLAVIGNLRWLIPLALDPRPVSVTMHTEGSIREIRTW